MPKCLSSIFTHWGFIRRTSGNGSSSPRDKGGDYHVTPEGDIGISYKEFPESAALQRWKARDFKSIEKEVASGWRQMLTELNFDDLIALTIKNVPTGTKLSSTEDVAEFAKQYVNSKYNQFIYYALELLGIPQRMRPRILERWAKTRWMPFSQFAPYAAHVLKINIFFYLCLHKSFISRERHSNLLDISYLYYLPFCMVFVSSDNLHQRVTPLFVENDQSFVKGEDLKADLNRINAYYQSHAEEIKRYGIMKFATYPPAEWETLIGHLFDKHLKPWRNNAQKHIEEIGKPIKKDAAFFERLKREQEESRPYEGPPLSSDEVKSLVITRKVPVQRGSWRLLPEGIENSVKDSDKAEE